ncbi:MAG: protocatechuate 3,4-dioxygenase subunit beta [Candidatus Binataceae bacterium]
MSMLLGYRRAAQGVDPPHDHGAYTSTHKRAPKLPPIRIAHTLSEITGPRIGAEMVGAADADLTHFAGGEALGERIVVTGRVLDDDGRPVSNALVEIWLAISSGRYAHDVDQHDAPLDPHFSGAGRVATRADGIYRFATIKPAAYPWKNHQNAWRPQHIHFSLFGPGFAARLITQMYFPGDPLLKLDPIYLSVPDPAARERLVCMLDIDATIPERALGYRFDIVLRGRHATPHERDVDGGVK